MIQFEFRKIRLGIQRVYFTTHLLILCIILLFITRLEIGVGLAGFGVAFLFLGMLLLFDKGLLAVGNVSGKNLSKKLY